MNITTSAVLLSFDELALWVEECKAMRMTPTGINVTMQANLLPPEMQALPEKPNPEIEVAVAKAEAAIEREMDNVKATVTMEEFKRALSDAAKRVGSREPVRELLCKFGGSTIRDVAESQWDECVKALGELK